MKRILTIRAPFGLQAFAPLVTNAKQPPVNAAAHPKPQPRKGTETDSAPRRNILKARARRAERRLR
ncbi:MAG: hypothetical protein AAGF20_10375 [Pseudomonadota bacterium]